MTKGAHPPRPHSQVKDHVQQRFSDVAANYRTSRVHAAGAKTLI